MNRWLLSICWCAAACQSEPQAPKSADEVVDAYRDALSVEPRDCGSTGILELGEGPGCPRPLGAAQQCFVDALSACESAEVSLSWSTTDAGPLPTVWFVEPSGAGDCFVTTFRDNSGDPYKGDYGDLTQAACASVVDVQSIDPANCGVLVTQDCEGVEEWYF